MFYKMNSGAQDAVQTGYTKRHGLPARRSLERHHSHTVLFFSALGRQNRSVYGLDSYTDSNITWVTQLIEVKGNDAAAYQSRKLILSTTKKVQGGTEIMAPNAVLSGYLGKVWELHKPGSALSSAQTRKTR